MTNASISDMSTSMTARLNSHLAERGMAYSSTINADIAAVQHTLDNEVFGTWVNTTTVVLNGTLVEFYDLVESTVQSALGSTIIWPSVNTFLFCILGSKVEALSHALTWIHDNAHFTLPTVSPNIFAVGNDTTDALVRPMAAAAVGGGTEGDEGVVQRLVDAYVRSLRKAMLMHWIFIGLWFGVLLVGIVTIILTARQEARDRDPNYIFSSNTIKLPPFLTRWRRPALQHRRSSGTTAYSTHPEKVSSLMDAFPTPPPPPPAPFTTPLPSPYPIAPSTTTPTHFEMSGGQALSSSYPYAVRSGQPPTSSAIYAPQPTESSNFAGRRTSQSPLTALSNWSKRLLHREEEGTRREGLRSFHLDPNRSTAYERQPVWETYHTVPSPSPRGTGGGGGGGGGAVGHPIYAQHSALPNPFGDEAREREGRRERESVGMGQDPFRTPFD